MLVSVIGEPGVGKSSFLHAVADLTSGASLFILEDPGHYPMVETIGDDVAEGMAFLNQASFIIRKIEYACSHRSDSDTWIEVDWLSCHLQWSAALASVGQIEQAGREALDSIVAAAHRASVPRPDLLVRLVSPDSGKRRKHRARPYEQSPHFSQLMEEIHKVDESSWWLDLEVPVIEVVVDQSSSDMAKLVLDVIAAAT